MKSPATPLGAELRASLSDIPSRHFGPGASGDRFKNPLKVLGPGASGRSLKPPAKAAWRWGLKEVLENSQNAFWRRILVEVFQNPARFLAPGPRGGASKIPHGVLGPGPGGSLKTPAKLFGRVPGKSARNTTQKRRPEHQDRHREIWTIHGCAKGFPNKSRRCARCVHVHTHAQHTRSVVYTTYT